MKLSLLWVPILALFSAGAQAQTVMSEAQFREHWLTRPVCVPLYLGRQDFYTANTLILDSIKALEKAGVIRVTKRPTIEQNKVLLEISLDEKVDLSQIDDHANYGKCLKAPPTEIERIVKIEQVKGPPRCCEWVRRSDCGLILMAERRPTGRAAVKDGA